MNPRSAVIIPAAGRGTRMQTEIPKAFIELAGKPILVHTVSSFVRCTCIDLIVVVVSEDRVENTQKMLALYDSGNTKITVVAGGARRQDSVKNGLDTLGDTCDIVLVHDAARPLVSEELISRCYKEIEKYGGAVAAIPVKDTLKQEGDDQRVSQTIERSGLWQAQTPQGAWVELLRKAYENNGEADVTDESSMLEKAGSDVRIVLGEEVNFKITRQQDLMLAETIMSKHLPSICIGHGFDAHCFAENRKLVLGGVVIDYPQGLAGHSDADVVCHALSDAILGASGGGDIGQHFPDSDDQFKGISSLILLDRIMEMIGLQKLALGNADITIICQAPRLAPYISEMKKTLADHCRTNLNRVNIKATTTEKMGYTGRQEGISCHAVVLLEQA